MLTVFQYSLSYSIRNWNGYETTLHRILSMKYEKFMHKKLQHRFNERVGGIFVENYEIVYQHRY